MEQQTTPAAQHVSPDLALDASHEHTHQHLHHDARAEKGRTDEVVYSTGTTAEKSIIPDQDPLDHVAHRRQHAGDKINNHGPSEKETGIAYEDGSYDAEKGEISSAGEEDPKNHKFSRLYAKYRIFVHLFFLLLFTGWWIAGLVLHRNDKNWIIPFLLWLAITIRIITFHVPITLVTKPMHWVWKNTGVRVQHLIPEKLRIPAGAALVIAVIIVGAMASPEAADNTRENRAVSLFGLAVFVFGLWATSRNRTKIVWHTVIVGMLVQFIVALFVLRTKAGYDIFNFISELCRLLLGFANAGVIFLTDTTVPKLPWFLISVLPAIIFFVAFVQMLYYWGIVQWFIGKFAVFFFWSMRVSGAEAVVAAASPFIGQGESAMLIKPFVAHLTQAELHQIMCSGFATIAGSVLVAYINLGVNGQALISSCVMSIPASLAISKMRYPETEETLTAGRVVIPDDDEHKAANIIHAFANGAWLGLKIAGMIVATLLCIIALVGLVDGLLTWWGRYINIGPGQYDLTLELMLGYIFYPVAFLLGVPRSNGDLLKVSRLIGIKVIENEFVAYAALQSEEQYQSLSLRSRLIATYSLCGFGNLGSLGTQIGVLSQISPGRSGDVSRVAVSALISGIISTLSSASIAGLLVTDQAQFFTPPVASNKTASA
ncbi:sodium/nucleoside cotransporter 1 /nucleoside cotransporter 1 [Venturia nashicola]|uniref:Sodium/nucleoside cotransporter 1 /nucleoside cotransporter 1 n=1 Tax=Venturia nashicola TaxID=86259 RepID=A0A4Z1PUH5_9PEZI|nr:sodium/nucleoside cotransporter 1 /nucleoside cotransporter 1 [Venturia nashicola]TLD38563.1 sodium/nucleoside cotransporter 1 /nucleoside cotransporter 1 [Venturia nashicola]